MEVINKNDEKLIKKSIGSSSSPPSSSSYSFEQQTTNDLNKYFMLKNKDNMQFSNRNHYPHSLQQPQLQPHQPNYPHHNHILRISNVNGRNERSKRHSTNFENYNSMHFDSFNSDALFAHKHVQIDGSNSSSLTTPSSLGGNDGITVKPMTKEKILSYSYYTNLNYEKPSKNATRETNTPASPYSMSVNSVNDSQHENETSLSHLNVSTTAYQIKRGGEKKASNSKPSLSDISSQQQQQNESEIFQKIMNKLSELPESVRLKNVNNEVLKSINEHKYNAKHTSNNSNDANNAGSSKHQNRYFQQPVGNNFSSHLDSNKAKLIVLNTSNIKTNNMNHDSNLIKRPKYKSMFIESPENEQMLHDKKLLSILKNTKINVNSQAGDLILSNQVPVSSKINADERGTDHMHSANNVKNNQDQKNIQNFAQESHSKSNNRDRASSPNLNEAKKKQDKDKMKKEESHSTQKTNNKEVIKVSDKVEFILFDKLDDITNPSRNSSKHSNSQKTSSKDNSNSLLNKSEKLNLKYQTLTINPRKNNYPDLTQNLKKFYSVNKTKVANKLRPKEQLNSSESSETNSETKKSLAFQTEEIEKEANFMTSSNDSDSSESTTNKQEKSKKTIATAKIINIYPENLNGASIKLNQQQPSSVLPFKNLDLKSNPLVPVRNIKLSPHAIETDSLYTKLLKEKSIESLKKKKYFNNLHNKSLLSSSSSSSSSNGNNFERSSKNSISKPSVFGMENNPYLSNMFIKSNNQNALGKSVDPSVLLNRSDISSRKSNLEGPDRRSKHLNTSASNGEKETNIQTAKNILKILENESLSSKKTKAHISSQPTEPTKNRLKARDINLNLRDLNFSDETLKKIEKVMEKNHLKQLNLYVNTEENETSSKTNLDKSKNLDVKDSSVKSTVSTQGNILQRKISTPPPIPHILDTKTKKYVSNVFKANENTTKTPSTPPLKHIASSKSKNNTITSSIRDGKIEKPIRVNHGLPPPPPALINRQTPTLNLFQSKINSNDKDLFMRKLATPLVGVSTPVKTNGNLVTIPPRYANSNLLSSREDSGKSVERTNNENQRYEFYLDKNLKTNNQKESITPSFENSLVANEKKKSLENILDELSYEKNKQQKKVMNKNRNDINNEKDMFSWNCAQLDNFLKAKNLNTILANESEKKTTAQNRMTPIIFSNPVKTKPAAQVQMIAPIIKESSKEFADTNKDGNTDQNKISELDNLSDDGSGIETNFYENYSKENDKRKKEGNGFLMLLPGIAIPIDTDAGDSDEDNSYNSS